MKCPKCGSDSGFYTKFQVEQYYDCNGEPCGTSDWMNETKYAWCVHCNKKILLSRLTDQLNKKGSAEE